MAKIHSAQIQLAQYSKHRTKAKMSKKALREAFMAGADFQAHSINGQITCTYCSCRDFAAGATVEMIENATSVDYFTYKPSVDPQENDVPAFMAGAPVELD